MAIIAAIAVTAIVVGAITWAVARRSISLSIVKAIGGREGSEPIAEHRRLLREAATRLTAAQEYSDLLKLSLDVLTSGVVVTDRAGTVLVRNRLASEMAERSHERTLIDATVSELLAVASRGTRVERELEIFGPPTRTLLLHAVPIVRESEIAGALAVIDDVTDHHRIEKIRRDFIANLSHELRTPVGAASLLGEMLVDEDDPLTRQQLTDRLLIETDRMTATIDDLLELSQIESDEQAFDDVVAVGGLINEALARTRVVAETKQIQVGSVVSPDAGTVVGNRDQLLTSLVNLVENAVKYSTSDDTVMVRAHAESSALHLIVQDTGPGIPARDLDRIFERFYRVDRSRDSATGGTGIGLSIVRHVALNHGGTVEVTSFEGEGSTFTMILPRTVPTNPQLVTDTECQPR